MGIRLPPRTETPAGLPVFIAGLLSLLVQAVVLRESLFGRHQAELASGIVLAAWIAGSGFGSGICGRVKKNRGAWLLGIALLPVLGFLQVGASRLDVLPLALTVLPVGFIAGMVFIQPFAFDRPARIYALEALGAAAGGCLFILLSPRMLAGEILAVSALISALGLLSCGSIAPAALMAVLTGGAMLLSVPGGFSEYLGERAFHSYSEVRLVPSPYGEVVTAAREGQISVFRSGILEASWPSLESAEATVFVPLAAALPKKVMYIGSSPEEARLIAEWPTVERSTAVIPDPALKEVAEYPAGTEAGDGRHFLSTGDAEYDLIVVSVGQPLTLLSNRFYTREFMRVLSRSLAPAGVAVIQLPGGINRLHPLEASLARSVSLASLDSFQWNSLVPISGLLLMMGNGPRPPLDGEELARRLDSLGIHGVFVNSGTLPFELSPLRTGSFREQVGSAEGAMNRDLRPEGFSLARELWNFRTGGTSGVSIIVIAIFVFVLIMFTASLLTGRTVTSAGVAAAGFTGLSVEVISLVAIQASTGHSWVLVGAVTGVFMTGGALGALAVNLGICRKPVLFIAMSAISAMSCAAALQLYDTGILSGTVLSVLLFLGTFTCGVAGGGAFTSAASLFRARGTGRIGLLDLAEHGGSAASCLLMPLILFPMTGAAAALLAAAAWAAVWAYLQRYRKE